MRHENFYKKFIEETNHPRNLKSLEPTQGSLLHMLHKGKHVINFASNDYLGLATHPFLIERSQQFIQKYGTGVASSRLVSGNLHCYDNIEIKLANSIGKEAALIMGAGYQTNFSVLESLLDPRVLGQEPLLFCDKLCHASMMLAARSMRHFYRFRHNDLNHLKILLSKFADSDQPKFILVESVYSMEGDEANLEELIAIADDFNAFLYVDDAHSVGVHGKKGWGKAADLAEHIPLIMGTFSKALGSFGAYVACSHTIRNYLIHHCKGLIYSTGTSPAVLGAVSAAIDLMPALAKERAKLHKYSVKVRTQLKKLKINVGQSSTHIIPWIVGNAEKTREISHLLLEAGILATAIQPPTVPPGSSRIRFCLSAAHSEEDIDKLLSIVVSLPSWVFNQQEK